MREEGFLDGEYLYFVTNHFSDYSVVGADGGFDDADDLLIKATTDSDTSAFEGSGVLGATAHTSDSIRYTNEPIEYDFDAAALTDDEISDLLSDDSDFEEDDVAAAWTARFRVEGGEPYDPSADGPSGEEMYLRIPMSALPSGADPSSLVAFCIMADGVTGFTLVADGTGHVPTMSAEQQAAVQSVLDQYAPNNRTVGFAFVDLRTGSGYAYNVDAGVYGASSFKAHVAVFACQDRVESGAIKQSSFRQNAETAVVWSDNDAYYRLRSASGAKGDALRTWLSGMGLDPAIAIDTFLTYSAREAATLWMNTYLYLSSGDPSLTAWLAELLSTTNVSMVRDGVSDDTKLDPSALTRDVVGEAAGVLYDSLPAGFMTAAAIEAAEESEKGAKEGEGSAVAMSDEAKNKPDATADAVQETLMDPTAESEARSLADSSNDSGEGEQADPVGAYEYLGFGLDASGDITPDIVVYNKAGWINGNSSDSVCDAGIIAEGDETYIMAIMTSAPDSTGNRQLVSDLASALWAARDTLQPPGLVKV